METIVGTSRTSDGVSRLRECDTATLTQMAVMPNGTRLTVRLGDGPDITVNMIAVPDRAGARDCAAGLRRLLHVTLNLGGRYPSARLAALGNRRLVTRDIPMPAALAFAQAGVHVNVTL
jgi:hypothetical protein